MRLSDDFIRSIVAVEQLDGAQLAAILRTAYLASEIDLDEDNDERATFEALGVQLSRVARVPVEPFTPVSPLPIDDEERRARIRAVAAELTTRSSRELAYAVAYVLAVSDMQLAPVETRFLDDLQAALGIDNDRAAELAATAASATTPGIADAM